MAGYRFTTLGPATPARLGARAVYGLGFYAATLGALAALGADGVGAPIVVSEKISIFAPLPAGYQ